MSEKFRFAEPQDPEKLIYKKTGGRKREIKPEQIERGRQEYEKRKNEMVVQAILKHVKAMSYRGLRVGSSVLAENRDSKDGYQIEAAYNYKPIELAQFGWDKLCAENNACSTVIMDGAKYIPALVVASHHKEIGQEPIDKIHSKEVLHSCHNCRNLFRDLKKRGIMSDETMLLFVDDGPLVYEDKNDTEEGIVLNNGEVLVIDLPKLKLIKDITEADVTGLPREETTLGRFLERYKYDEPAKRKDQRIKPPYDFILER